GWIFALNGLLIAFFEMVIINSLSSKKNELSYISFGLVLLGLSFVVLNLPIPNALSLGILSCLLFTAGEIFTMPFMMSFWMNRSNDSNRGQYASLYTVAYSSAHITGPFIGGFIADHFGFYYLWVGIFLFCLMNAFIFNLLRQNISTITR
ncbi:MAG: MFS transporter, partial [Saprospiraceae bacterium]